MSTAQRDTVEEQKFERWLQVQRGLPELLETGLSSLVAVTVEYLRGAIASAALSSGEVGTLISGIRRFLLLPPQWRLSSMTTSHTSVLLWLIHKSWPESAGGATLWPSVPLTASAYFNSFGIAGIGQPKTRRLVVHARRQYVLLECTGIANFVRRLLETVPTSARSQPIWTLPPERHFTLFKQVLKRLGQPPPPLPNMWWGRNRFLATYPRHPRTSTTRTMVQHLQERAYFLRTSFVPADTDARLDSLVELAPVLLASAPLPPPTPTPTFLQWG